MADIRAERMGEEHLWGAAEIIARQAMRWRSLDSRLREEVDIDWVIRDLEGFLSDNTVFSAVSIDDDEVVGCAAVWIRELPPESEALSFMGARDGMVKVLALVEPDDARFEAAAAVLFDAIRNWWDEQQATGANLIRPVCDIDQVRVLEDRGWGSVFTMAQRPAGLLPPGSRPPFDGLTARFAGPADIEPVVALHLEEYGFHAGVDPTMRMVPGIEADIRENLAQSFKYDNDADEVTRRRVFVVDYKGEPVASSITYLYEVGEHSPGILAEGRYCHIGSTGVRADMRGKGVGRAMVGAIIEFYEALEVDAYTLWYHTSNPLSSTFWPRLGWTPLSKRWVNRTSSE